MKRLISVLTVLVLGAPAVQAAAAPVEAPAPAAAEVTIFAGGGTQLTNGYFFPGTAVSNDGEIVGVPMEVAQGSDIRFVNLDHFVVAGGSHKMTSFKKVKRGGRKVPLFSSKMVAGPGEDLVITSHVKPGIYAFYCPVHNGMLGQIEVK